MAAMLAFGVLGQVSVIVAGPSTGLLAVGKAGYLPHILQKTNAHGIPTNILLLQGFFVTVLSAAFTILPSVQSAYQILSQMAVIIYLFMCIVMYVAAISLRYSQPDIHRPFRIPGGNFGMWFVGMVGLLGALVALGFQFHSTQSDQHRKPRNLYWNSDRGLRHLCSHSLYFLRFSQTKLEGAGF